MQYRTILTLLAHLMFSASGSGQDNNIREQVYLHVNSHLLLTGETLYFSAYTMSAATGEPSPLSSILYVELVGENGVPVFQKKLGLRDGRGRGDYFIPSLVNTGHYRLIAYTRWMKNFDDYFQVPLTIINPFEAYQIPGQNTGLVATFHPEGGKLLAGTSNTLGFSVTGPAGNGVSFTGKIVTDGGDKIADFAPYKNGIGRVSFVAKKGKTYRAILEDDKGDFYFFDLPAPESGAVLQVRDRGHAFRIGILGDPGPGATVTVHDAQNVILRQQVTASGSFSLTKQDLREGIYRVVMTGPSDEVLSSRLIIHTGIPKQEILSVEERYKNRAVVKIPVALGENARVSVSVRRTDLIPGTHTDAIFGSLFNSIVPQLQDPSVYFEKGTPDQQALDDLMLVSSWKWDTFGQVEAVALLPETRGALISGRLIPATDSLAAGGKDVIYTITGENYQVQAARTSQNGHFIFNIDPEVGDREAYISVVNDEHAYSFALDPAFLQEYPPFKYHPVYLDSLTVSRLVERSVRNQIENAYYRFKTDSSMAGEPRHKQFSDFDFLYPLDDYNRFPTLEESFIEYIPTVAARTPKSGAKFKVRPKYLLPQDKDPLVLIDGVPTDAGRILEFSPYKIKSIGVINNRYFMGPLVVDGIIAFHTYEANLQGFVPGANTLKLKYQGLDPQKRYRFPKYGSRQDAREDETSRIPDFREQLYWDPEVAIGREESYQLEFYTSDTDGRFEVAIEGFTDQGQPVSIRKYFTVE